MSAARPFTLGLYLRNMGPQSDRATILAAARAAEAAGIDDLWVADHIAIPPDNAEGSGGRYLDPLATLAFVAAATRRIGLGTGVLVLPYRPPLATAKWVATIQELSEGRLLLGVGVGWMEAEFRAAGVPYARRAPLTDQTLAFLERCFAADEMEANGQRFLFKPRPGSTADHRRRGAATRAATCDPSRGRLDAGRRQRRGAARADRGAEGHGGRGREAAARRDDHGHAAAR
jgi:alkanesulfonate monooxygenase SsuD/methylene tetrahydromethanopterin reductase-like flavin-dependent oxidoreductase (luciferase family)